MKKLEDIPKKDHFSAPDGYFESLPGRIQARLEKPRFEIRPAFRFALQYAVPMVVLMAIGIGWYSQRQQEPSAEKLLAAIDTEQLVAYLAEEELSSYDELMEEIELNEAEVNAIEQTVYDLQWQDENLDELLEDMDDNSL